MASVMRWYRPGNMGKPPKIKNHSATCIGDRILVFGGFDGRRNHNTIHMLDCASLTWSQPPRVVGTPPAGRNGHTATLIDDDTVLIIGGWLGHGPFAAEDCHALHLPTMSWHVPDVKGEPPGPCNMHTADFVPEKRSVYLFRGGNGVQYLNELHALNVDSMTWTRPNSTGDPPIPRANHGSAVFRHELFLFGGWDGMKRLNDVHVFNTDTLTWSALKVSGMPPCPRAGMTLSRVFNRIVLFGGSGPSAKCFGDLQILDPTARRWVPVKRDEAATNVPATAHAHTAKSGGAGGAGAGSATPRWAPTPPPLSKDGCVDDTMVPGPTIAPSPSVGSANPNEEDAESTVRLIGSTPGRRAGHTSTVVGREIIVFGGSCASEYWNDLHVLDTDPKPSVVVSSESTVRRLHRAMQTFVNNPEFSDVTFLVEGREIRAHRVLLSLISDKFRAMFSLGFKEATQRVIEVPDKSYDVFLALLEHLYTGDSPLFGTSGDESRDFGFAVELLQAADEYMLDRLRQECEQYLASAVRDDTVVFLSDIADRTNSPQLMAMCAHHMRTRPGPLLEVEEGKSADTMTSNAHK